MTLDAARRADNVREDAALRPTRGFTLIKWYVDCLSPDGRAAIVYWASLGWRSFSVVWQNVSVYEVERPPLRRSALARISPPAMHSGRMDWRASEIGISIDLERTQDPFEACLLDRDDGTVEWRVEAPVAQARFQVDGHSPIEGCGYAERLVLTVPPWRLPIEELRWGRWANSSATRSMVWIDWKGSLPRTWLFVDGHATASTLVSDESVTNGRYSLSLARNTELVAPSMTDIANGIPGVRRILPRKIFGLRQTRWQSTGILAAEGAVLDTGHAIHELVRF